MVEVASVRGEFIGFGFGEDFGKIAIFVWDLMDSGSFWGSFGSGVNTRLRFDSGGKMIDKCFCFHGFEVKDIKLIVREDSTCKADKGLCSSLRGAR